MNQIAERRIQNNLTYTLDNNEMFSVIAYRIMQNEDYSGFVKCFQIKKNGQIELVYLTSEYKALSQVLQQMDDDHVITVILNIFRRLSEFQGNGFLNLGNLKVDMDKIYLNPKTMEVYFMYLPVNVSNDLYENSTEYEIKMNLIQFLQMQCNGINGTEKIKKIIAILMDTTLDVLEIQKTIIRSINIPIEKEQENQKRSNTLIYPDKKKKTPNSKKILLLKNNNGKVIEINRTEMILGRQSPNSGGTICSNDHKKISRKHCKIFYENEEYFITDLGSLNATHLNEIALSPMKPVKINDGDTIRIVDIVFSVYIKVEE